MEEGVEFLDSCPLVFLLNVGVWFLLCLGRSSNDWLNIWLFLGLRHLVLALRSTGSGTSSWSSAWSSTYLRFHVFVPFARSSSLRALWNSALGILIASPLCKNSFLLLPGVLFKLDLFIKLFQIIFCKPVRIQKSLDLIVNVCLQVSIALAILVSKLGDEHAFELLTFLNFLQFCSPCLWHPG